MTDEFVAIPSRVEEMFVSCSSDENCASWDINCELSVGLLGSWCWSCATSSLRKSSLPSTAVGELLVTLVVGGMSSGEVAARRLVLLIWAP